jgi:hypothetical protein
MVANFFCRSPPGATPTFDHVRPVRGKVTHVRLRLRGLVEVALR